jgi:valyl-tRNA synthetase
MPHELPKTYDPGAIERRWAEYWVEEKLFDVSTPAGAAKTRIFSLLLPPPNVTGRLHMGHMLNHTEMDIIIRWHRMMGDTTLWLPGTDHAGIATQMMVERQLAAEGRKRQDLGREAFIKRVWEWREHYGGAILEQMKRLGDSVDWSREYFTMDADLSAAVKEVFVRLYNTRDAQGERLIYRGDYIVNWCPRCGTAISDLEVVHEDQQGKLYSIRYPVNGSNKDEYVTVATTRPETMLGDTAVAVNPADERYKHLHGKTVRLPLMNRDIPIITDEIANPEFGTGAVKITPAHDPNDFQAGLRHKLPMISVMDESAHMNENAGRYQGMDRFKARARVLADLEDQGFLVSEKDYVIAIGKCDRCKTVVEPRVSTQWFVRIKPLADRAIEVVEKDYIRFTPENYRTIYLNWMRNIYDWCISRQLWWGHRIPAWHCADCKEITVAREAPAACERCGSKNIRQDPDVLDTWFSSALLPFTTLGWPDAKAEKERGMEVFYPTSLLVTGFDILFMWVARMIMMGCWFMGGEDKLDTTTPEGQQKLKESVPFREVYVHALVRDAERQKMSKTKGNVIDPIEITEKYGTDAVRFALASMASPGTDIAFSESRTEGYRAFANKIWNAARFIFMNVDRAQQSDVWRLSEFQEQPLSGEILGMEDITKLDDRWIVTRFNLTAFGVRSALEDYRFDEAADKIYDFFWKDLCDWYIELVKDRISGELTQSQRADSRVAFTVLLRVFEGSLRLLAPFMPFITEEIWQAIYDGKPPYKSIALAPYPSSELELEELKGENAQAIHKMNLLQSFITSVRNLRVAAQVPQKQLVPIKTYATGGIRALLDQRESAIKRLAGASSLEYVRSLTELGPNRGRVVVPVQLSPDDVPIPPIEFSVVFERQLDLGAERDRLNKELKKLETEFANAQRQLGNENFLSKAPANVVEGLRKRHAELEMLIPKTRTSLEELGR